MSKFWTCLWKKNPETRESGVHQYQKETLKTERRGQMFSKMTGWWQSHLQSILEGTKVSSAM